MKKRILLALSIIGILSMLLVFASCGGQGHEHDFDAAVWQSDEANHWNACTVDGCTEVFNSAAHTYTVKSTTPAKCGVAGETVEVCSCGKEKKTPIAALEHIIVEKVVAPTCTKNGYTAVSCSRDGCTYKATINVVPASHITKEEVIVPTCTEGGKTIVTCTVEGCDYVEEKDQREPLGHDKKEEVVAPSCTEKGYTNVTCTRCDFFEKTNETDIIAHKYVETVVAPTCLEEGYTASVCSECGDALDKTNFKDALGHNGVDGTVVAPTCSEQGYTVVICSRCDIELEQKDFVDSLGHDIVAGTVVEPTCSEQGYTTVTCSRCDFTDKTEFVDALGHDYYFGDDAEENYHYIIIEEPTCEAVGKRVYWCFRCNDYPFDGDNNIREIPALGHDEQYEIVPPTCTLKGTTIVTCSRCDLDTTKDDVDPLGHTYYKEEDAVEGTHYEITLAPTCEEKGEKSYYCQREGCGSLATEDTTGKGEIPALDHNWVVGVNPWCGNDSVYEYYCDRVCRETPCTSVKTEEAEEKIKHTYDVERVVITETCVDYATFECPVCNKPFVAYEGDELGQPTGVHNYNVELEIVPPTCTEKGYTIYGCSAGECNLSENRDYTEVVAHTLSEVSENGTVTCQVCNKSYVDVTAEKSSGSDALCICGKDPCVCGGTTTDWEGFAKPKEPMAIVAEETFAISEVKWADGNHPLAIGKGIIVLYGTEETEFTVVIYANDGEEALYTFTASGAYAMIDLYQYEAVGMVEIISTTDASVSFYKTI